MAADSSVIKQAGNHRTDAFRVLVLTSMLLASQALVGPGTRPAMAHTHPSNVELGAPAVVRVETRVRVDIWLIEHNRHGKHIGLIHKTYEPLAQAGSGFAVDPSGVIVAAGGVVQVDDKQARNYAVNHIFHDRDGGRAPLPKVETATHTIRNLPDDPLNGLVLVGGLSCLVVAVGLEATAPVLFALGSDNGRWLYESEVTLPLAK